MHLVAFYYKNILRESFKLLAQATRVRKRLHKEPQNCYICYRKKTALVPALKGHDPVARIQSGRTQAQLPTRDFNPLHPELNPICYLLPLLGAHHFLHVSRIKVKLLTFRVLMSYIYIWSTHS